MTSYLLLASSAGNFARHLSDKVSEIRKDPSALRTVFITTAANTYKEKPWMEADISSFEQANFKIERLDIAAETEKHVTQLLTQADICIVGGGNTIYLLEEFLKKNLKSFFAQRVAQGMVCVGSSAGAVIASPNISLATHFEDRENPPKIISYDALDLVNFHVLPHWGSEHFKNEYLEMLPSGYNHKIPLVTLTDEQAVEVVDGKMEIITC